MEIYSRRSDYLKPEQMRTPRMMLDVPLQHRAACKGHADLCQLLLDNDAVVNKQNCGWTALHGLETIRLLLEHGANLQNNFMVIFL